MATKEDFDYDGLTDEEIAALEAEYNEEAGAPGELDDEDDAEDDDVNGGSEESGTGEEAEETPKADEPGSDEQPDTKQADSEPVSEAEQAKPEVKEEREFQAKIDVPADLNEQFSKVQTDLEALGQKFEEGEIDHGQYHREFLKLSQQQARLIAQAERIQAQQEADSQRWNWEVERFMEDNKQFSNPILNGALSSALNTLYADVSNEGKTFRWFLNTAAAQVNEAMGLNKPAPESQPTAQPKPKVQTKAKPELPQTLGGLPAAGQGETTGDKYAYLDKLSGAKLDAALDRLSPADMDEWLDTRRMHG